MKQTKGKSVLSIVKKYHPEVKTVVDAKKPITIIVSKADCRNGNLKEPDNCAMAKALQREHDGAIISLSTAYIVDGEKATRYKVPESVAREIVSFDRNHKFAAGEYSLRVPSDCERIGPRNRPQPVKNRKYTNKDKPRYHRTAGLRSL